MILFHSIVAQEGGGAYIQGSGKLINCVVTKNYASNGFGVSGTGGNVTNCTITNNYYLNQAIINSGDLLLSDGSVYTTYDTNGNIILPLPSNVTAVCFWSNGNNDFLNAKAWFIAVDETTLMWTPSTSNQFDITNLFDYSTPVGAIADQDGAGNTNKIISDSQFSPGTLNVTNCAAYYCNQYGGTLGIWYLPSIGQMQQLNNSLTKVNNVLIALKKTQISTVPTDAYWSSTETAQWEAWCYDFSSNGVGSLNRTNKTILLKVRAIRNLQQSN
jgi:hypothetical protein